MSGTSCRKEAYVHRMFVMCCNDKSCRAHTVSVITLAVQIYACTCVYVCGGVSYHVGYMYVCMYCFLLTSVFI